MQWFASTTPTTMRRTGRHSSRSAGTKVTCVRRGQDAPSPSPPSLPYAGELGKADSAGRPLYRRAQRTAGHTRTHRHPGMPSLSLHFVVSVCVAACCNASVRRVRTAAPAVASIIHHHFWSSASTCCALYTPYKHRRQHSHSPHCTTLRRYVRSVCYQHA